MSVVNRISELERENSISLRSGRSETELLRFEHSGRGENGSYLDLAEFLLQLERRKSILVETVVPCDTLEHLKIASDQPVPALVPNELLVRMSSVAKTELAGASFLFAVRVNADV